MQRNLPSRVNNSPSSILTMTPGEQKAIDSVRLARKGLVTLQKGSPAKRLVSSITLPKETDCPVRIGSAFGSDPTATAKLFRKLNLIFPTAGETDSDLAPTDMAGFLFRDALRSFIYAFGLTATDTFVYGASFVCNVSCAPGVEYYPEYDTPFYPDLSSSTVSPFGPYLYYGRNSKSDLHRGILMSAGMQMTTILQPTATFPAGKNVIVNYWYFSKDTWESVGAILIVGTAGGTATCTATVTGYYSFTLTTDAEVATLTPFKFTGSNGIGVNPGVAGMVWAQLSLPNLEDVLPVVKAFRTISASLMLTNTASPLNRQGQIVGLQLPRGSWPFDYLDFDEVASDLKSMTINIVNGMYGFLKPTAQSDFDMTVFQFSNSFSIAQTDYVFDLIPTSDYLTIHAQVVDPNGRQGFWTPAYCVEYESISQWSDLKISDAKPNDLAMALQAIAPIPQWHENDFHLGDIWEWIKDTAKDVWGVVKEVGPIVAPLLI